MLNLADLPTRVLYEKDFVNEQNLQMVMLKTNIAGMAFDANGFGPTDGTSTAFLLSAGGFADQRVTGVVRYSSPTTAGSENVGIMARASTLDSLSTSQALHYLARIRNGRARLTKVEDGVFSSDLTSEAYAVPADEDVTIEFSVVGATLTAVFTSATAGTTTLSYTDPSPIPNGLPGIRGVSTFFRVKTLEIEQL